MRNDLVNFVDPTGLDGDDGFINTPGDADVIVTNTHTSPWPGYGGAGGSGRSHPPLDEAPGDGNQLTLAHELWHFLYNPNCAKNAVTDSPGTGRPFDANPGPDGRVFHDGIHVLSPAHGGKAITLPALAGEVIYSNLQEAASKSGPALYTVDVQPTRENFIVTYKDLTSLSFPVGQKGIKLAAGDVIGTVRPAGDPKESRGLHVTLVNPEFYNAFRRETKAQAQQNRLGTFNTRKMFIDPLGPGSPIRCL